MHFFHIRGRNTCDNDPCQDAMQLKFKDHLSNCEHAFLKNVASCQKSYISTYVKDIKLYFTNELHIIKLHLYPPGQHDPPQGLRPPGLGAPGLLRLGHEGELSGPLEPASRRHCRDRAWGRAGRQGLGPSDPLGRGDGITDCGV